MKIQYSDKRWFQAFVPPFQGIEKRPADSETGPKPFITSYSKCILLLTDPVSHTYSLNRSQKIPHMGDTNSLD